MIFGGEFPHELIKGFLLFLMTEFNSLAINLNLKQVLKGKPHLLALFLWWNIRLFHPLFDELKLLPIIDILHYAPQKPLPPFEVLISSLIWRGRQLILYRLFPLSWSLGRRQWLFLVLFKLSLSLITLQSLIRLTSLMILLASLPLFAGILFVATWNLTQLSL